MSLDAVPGQNAIQDAWDGYAAERQEILESFVGAGVQNLTVLTGDIHTFIAGNLTTTGRVGGTPIGVELVGGSATSPGIPEALGVPASTLYDVAAASDPHIKYVDLERRGYAVVEVDKKALKCEFKAIDPLTPKAKPTLLKRFQVNAGDPTVQVL